MKTLLVLTLIFVFAIPNLGKTSHAAQARRAQQTTAKREAAHGKVSRKTIGAATRAAAATGESQAGEPAKGQPIQSTQRQSVRGQTPSGPSARAQLPQSLPIRRVILYSNGVAYIERRGMVEGHAEISLSFKQSQVDDVLKSMIVLDLGKGRIGAVSYNSSAPPSARMADIPFSIAPDTESGTSGGLAKVLSQLQGARVVVSTATRTATGSILTVEERKSQIDADKPPVTTHSLVINSESGELLNFDLAEVRSVKLTDDGARRDVSEFASAAASARRRDAKTIVVTSDGAGSREMLVSYTIAAPIWKTTYRVVLDQAGKPFFQGWAIIDNVGDEDWNSVALSLISGTPVSFIQPIQQPFYRYRPIVPMPQDLKLEPQVYEPGETQSENMGKDSSGVAGAFGAGTVDSDSPERRAQGFTQRQIVQLPLNNRARNMVDNLALTPGVAPPAPPSLSETITGENSGVEAAATGNEVGDLFEYKIDQPVTVPHDRSALIPIVQARMDGERVSIYNEAIRRDRPMGGMLLRNTTALTLEGGSMTIIDGDAYAGEALMERLKPAEQRLISFALDLGTLVTARVKEDRAPTFLVRVVNGVFQAHYHQTNKKVYTLTNQTDKARVVFVEHPVRQEWTLTDDTPKPDGKSARYYRFRVPLEPHQTSEVGVTEQRVFVDSYALSNFTRPDLELFIARNYIDAPTRAALEKLIDIRGRMAANEGRLQAINSEATEIAQDQARLRENIKALSATAEARQLITRYVAKADTQESRLEQLEKDRRAALEEQARLHSELATAIRGFSLDRQLR
ncbi:MAG TPA: hypothetical protein VMS31_20530 [Pyrinomonadaceae bacterium]|nr:hypothetical protein [Pyrinomonadaceae bacterium]